MLWWRPDGTRAKNLPATRRIMPFLMKGRNESVVYFEQTIDLTALEPFLERERGRTGPKINLLHVLMWHAARLLAERPRLNRFAAGPYIWDRDGVWISFSAKKAKTDGHPIVVVKRRIDPAWSLEDLVRAIDEGVKEGRSDKKSTTDKELSVFLALPTLVLGWLVRLVMLLDGLGLLPGVFIRNDPLFASLFIANLGSVGLDAGYHHLYEYGNIPIFMVIGKSEDMVVVGPDRAPVVRRIVTLRYSFDERIEDGLYCARSLELLKWRIEHPEEADPPDVRAGVKPP